jgi:hypothetical protein
MSDSVQVDRDKLIRDLRSHVVEVLFTKVNGTQRSMKCTLMAGRLPPNYDPDFLLKEHAKPENKNTVVAWDVENNGWRSFRVDSVQYCQSAQGWED